MTQIPADLPADLKELVATMGRYTPAATLKEVVAALCRFRPMSRDELASVLGRNGQHLSRECLRVMLREGSLRLKYPKVPSHPRQKYQTPDDACGEDAE